MFITSNSSQNIQAKPTLFVNAACMIGQSGISVDFTAHGFQPNTDVVLQLNKTNSLNSIEPVIVHNIQLTDSFGSINGTFTLHSQIGPNSYKEYFLHVYDKENPETTAMASLNIC